MGGLVGVVRLDGGTVDTEIINRWRAGANGAAPDCVHALSALAFAAWAPPYSPGELPGPFALPSGATLIAEARIDDRPALRDALGLDDALRSDPALVAAACERWGADAAARLYGEFAFAHWDPTARRLTLARDHLGVRALFYHFDGHAVSFATALHHLLAMPHVPRDLDELRLADFMVGATAAPERTIYRHIHRVPAGGTATFSDGACRSAHYWTLDGIAPVRFASDDAYVEAARERLDAAVASRIPASGKVGAMLSGGFDSAAAAATAARLLGDRGLTGFTRVAGGYNPYTRFDERAFAGQVAAQHSNIDWVVIDALHQAERDTKPEIEAARMGLPTNGFPTTWFEPLHQRAAELGIRTLFSGALGNATLSWSGNALGYEQARRGKLSEAMRGQGKRAALDDIVAAFEPRALRRWRMVRAGGRHRFWQQMTALSPDFLDQLGYGSHTRSPGHDIMLKVPRSGAERRWTMLHAEDRFDRLAYLRGVTPHEMVDPYTDRRLLEFTLGVPEDQYQRDGVRRWLARRALADRLPAELLAQRARGRQVGEWYQLGNLRREHTAAAVDALARSPLASRVLDIAHLKKLVDTWPKDADSARATERQHRYVLHYSVTVGAFLRWHEGQHG